MTRSRHMLPAAITTAEYEALRSDPQRWEPVLADIAEAHGLGRPELRAVGDGSNLVARLGDDLVIKLFPPLMRHQYESERLTLRHLQGQLSTLIPEIVIDGETSGWPYLVMTRLEGVSLSAVWGECTEEEKRSILYSMGRLTAEVQAVPPGPLTALEPEWKGFMAGQAKKCRSHHERSGLALHLLDQIDPYLEKTRSVLPESFQPAILTGEYTPGNLLMTRQGGSWQISGLIDFGDVMVGFSEYDLLGPTTFLTSGAEQVRALLDGFGYDGPAATRGLGQRLMRMLLLHRFSRLVKWQDRVRSFDELERLLWPL